MSDSKIAEWARPESEDEIRRLLVRARGGDPTSNVSIRRAMDQHPEIWQAYGDLAGHAQNAWIDLIAGVDLALKESLGRQVEAMTAELAGPDPSPLEALLVARIAAGWLQVSYADAAAARPGEMSIQQGNYLRKRQDSAHRRYLSAVGALAMVRRLLGSAGGAPGKGSKPVSRPRGPVIIPDADRSNDGPEEIGTINLQDDPSAAGLVLEFGPITPGVGRGRSAGMP